MRGFLWKKKQHFGVIYCVVSKIVDVSIHNTLSKMEFAMTADYYPWVLSSWWMASSNLNVVLLNWLHCLHLLKNRPGATGGRIGWSLALENQKQLRICDGGFLFARCTCRFRYASTSSVVYWEHLVPTYPFPSHKGVAFVLPPNHLQWQQCVL